MASKINMLADKSTKWIGSIPSLVFHTLVFAAVFLAGVLGADWNKVLLVLTTVVSLEAIYLAIFIQMTVNKNTQSLKEVEADIDEIQEDVDEIQEGVETKSEQEQALAAIRNELSHLMKSIENLSQLQTPESQKPKSIRQRISKMLLRKN